MTKFCTECHLGLPHIERVTWACLVGDQLVVVPQIEALICDACGTVVYDHVALGRLEALLHPNSSASQRPRASLSTRVPGGTWSSDRPIRAV